jgi:hypothetical protein
MGALAFTPAARETRRRMLVGGRLAAGLDVSTRLVGP